MEETKMPGRRPLKNGMTLSELIEGRFEVYGNRGHIADTCHDYLNALDRFDPTVKSHTCRVALAADRVARQTGRDSRAAFYGGLLHDYGKILLPAQLFDGHDVSPEEYRRITEHAEKGFALLKDVHLFSALIAGLHHEMGGGGTYGIRCDEIPDDMGPETLREVVDIARIISAVDFSDAALHRKTSYLGPEDGSLRDKMLAKFGHDEAFVDVVLSEVYRYRDLVEYE